MLTDYVFVQQMTLIIGTLLCRSTVLDFLVSLDQENQTQSEI